MHFDKRRMVINGKPDQNQGDAPPKAAGDPAPYQRRFTPEQKKYGWVVIYKYYI